MYKVGENGRQWRTDPLSNCFFPSLEELFTKLKRSASVSPAGVWSPRSPSFSASLLVCLFVLGGILLLSCCLNVINVSYLTAGIFEHNTQLSQKCVVCCHKSKGLHWYLVSNTEILQIDMAIFFFSLMTLVH